MRKGTIDLIFRIANEKNPFDLLEKELAGLSKGQLIENIIGCGILPEMFEHDSSEEKLWAKYSDIMLSLALSVLGIKAKVIRTRGDSADVLGEAKNYSIVGDAKTFRLSRSAKNQKDFKIKALDDWRRESDFALLVSPLAQYPVRRSQIYCQAVERNVTLLSYTHLRYLLQHHTSQDLSIVWRTGTNLQTSLKREQQYEPHVYWQAIDATVCRVVHRPIESLKEHKLVEIAETKRLGAEGIAYWRKRILQYRALSRQDAIKKLIKAEKIEAKIDMINKSINQEFAL
jgi:hypothetical protein